jgi:putative transposase
MYFVGMLINKTYEFRIYPTKEQATLLAVHFGQARFVYNYFLRKRIDFYAANAGSEKQGLNYYDTANMLTELKKQPDTAWLQESNAQVLQQSLRHLDVAYNNFFNKHAQFPSFKRKQARQSLTVPQGFKFNPCQGTLTIPKITPFKIVAHRNIEEMIKHVIIKKNPSGKYFASILCETQKDIKPKETGGQIGIDLGLKSFLVTSENEKVSTPQFLRASEDKLKLAQRRLSRKQKGSANRAKAQHKVTLIHEKISNQRNDFLHKLSHRLISENQALFAEDLNVKEIMANHHLAKSVADAGWSEFIRQVKYKSEWNGVHFCQIDRFFPSSKRCHTCGWINQSLTLKDREWTCQGCGHVLDRDCNAAQNILLFGAKQIGSERPESTLSEKRRTKALH